MKYIDEFRAGKLARQLALTLTGLADTGRQYHFMEFCGGHTHTLFRYGITDLLPENIEMHHGPGCPVCVLPMARMDMAIELAMRPEVILCSYGDMLRVPGSKQNSLFKARALGADVRVIYSPADSLGIARENPGKEIVFFAIGFETTTPPTAQIMIQAQKQGITNFSVFCNHVLTPPAITAILSPARTFSPTKKKESAEHQCPPVALDGLVGPGHVSLITGSRIYEALVRRFHKPVVIAGFEPIDLLHSIIMLVKQVNEGRHEVEVQYSRAVKAEGNLRAQELVASTLTLRESFEWRGFGEIPNSALRINDSFAALDAEKKFTLPQCPQATENKACRCPEVLRGQIKPPECKLFGNHCTPDNPIGACMVSAEGACAAYYEYKPDHGSTH